MAQHICSESTPFGVRAVGISLLMIAQFGVQACAQEPAPTEALQIEETDAHWRAAGESDLAQGLAMVPNTSQAHGIILFIGDGMGVSTITAARIYEGQLLGRNGEEHVLSFENFDYLSLIKTYNVNQQTPDSAGTMTAIVTGVKTDAGLISVNAQSERRNCKSSQGKELQTILEQVEQAGWSTGVVTTARLTHATPAAAYAHVPERGWEDDSAVSRDARGAGCRDIALQLIEMPYGDGLEVALGGGRRHFLPREQNGQAFVDPEYKNAGGRRLDGRDLTREWVDAKPRSAYVWNKAQFDALDPNETDHLLGLFNPSHMQYEIDRKRDAGGEPSLAEMTAKAIQILARNPKGYLLIVEGGRIDHAHHATNAARALMDTVALARAVTVADEMTADENTLMVVTADHSHVFTIAGYPTRGNPILGVSSGNNRAGEPSGSPELDAANKPYTTLGYANGLGARTISPATTELGDARIYEAGVSPQRRLDLSKVDTLDDGYHQEALVPAGAETHGGEDVALFAKGPQAHLFRRTHEQSYIYYVLRHASGIDAEQAAAD